MIIITENKKQHYIIKNFLDEISNINLSESKLEDELDRKKHYVNLYPILKGDELNKKVVAQDQPVTMQQLKKASKLKPKMRNLAKLVKSGITVSILAAATYFASDINNKDVAKDIANNNNISIEKVEKEIKQSPEAIKDKSPDIAQGQLLNIKKTQSQDNLNSKKELMTIDTDLNIPEYNDSQAFKFMLKKEKFKASPYVDRGNISIGFGSNIDRNGKKGKSKQYTFKGKKKKSSMLKATKLALKSYGITRVPKTSTITKAEALKIAKIAWKDHKKSLFLIDPWVEDLPGPVIHVCVDMGYNVGSGVFNDFEELEKHFFKASTSYTSFLKSKKAEHLLVTIQSLKDAIKELENSKAYRATKKARDNYLKKNPNKASWKTRFEEHIDNIQSVINIMQNAIDNLNQKNENMYSLKFAYKMLYN